MKNCKIYTRKGDGGQTSLADGSRIEKDNVRLEAYGTVDELNAHIGLLLALLKEGAEEKALIVDIQNRLFDIGALLATPEKNVAIEASEHFNADCTMLEKAIDALSESIHTTWKGFILPGGVQAAAHAHVCRTVCRRAERRMLTLSHEANLDGSMIAYINRLSDFFFILAQKINFDAKKEETYWKKM